MSTVQQILDSVKYTINDKRFTSGTGIVQHVVPMINDALKAIDWALFVEKSDMVRTRFTPAISFDIDEASQPLPDDFLALHEKPWITDQVRRLTLISGEEDELAIKAGLDGAGPIPLYYEIMGKTIYLYPAPSVACTVEGFYFHWSTPVEDADSVVPFDGLLDQPIKDYLVKLYAEANTTREKSGELLLSGGTQTMQQLLAAMVRQVKSITKLRPGVAKRRPYRARFF